MSAINTEIQTLASEIHNLDGVRDRFKDALEATGGTYPDNPSFTQIIDYIYNKYMSTNKSFINIDFSNYPTGSDISNLMTNFNRVTIIRDAIINALRARNVVIEDDNISLNDLVNKVAEISDTDPTRMEPITDITITPKSTNSCIVTISNYDSSKNYYYSTDNFDSGSYTSWQRLTGASTEINVELTDKLVFTDGSKIYLSTSMVQPVVDPNPISLTFDYGSAVLTTKLTVSSSIPYTKVYYGFTAYKGIHQYEKFYGIDQEGNQFLLWDQEHEIVLDDNNDPRVYVIVVDNDDYVVGANSAKSKAGFIANTLYMESEAVDDVYDRTKIIVLGNLAPGDIYCYMEGTYRPMYNESIVGKPVSSWDGVSLISAKNRAIYTFFETTIDYKVRKYGNVVANVNIREISNIGLTSTATETDLESVIVISTPKHDPINQWFYKFVEDTTLPKYGDDIDSTYISTDNAQFNVYKKDGTKMIVVEYNAVEKIIAAGSITIQSKDPHVKIICLKSEVGTNLGYTKVIVVSPPKDDGNTYLYTKGNAPIVYGDVLRGWAQWNGTEEIAGFKENDLITVAEVTADNFEVRKVGVVGANPRPLELLPLTLTSQQGSFERYTFVTVSPMLSAYDHVYRYAFNVHEPELYDDVSSWMLWDGSSEIYVEDDYGIYPTLVVAECTADNLVLKTGSVLARVKAEDPRLVVFNITLTRTSSDNTANISLSTTPPDTFHSWKYKYYYMEEIIDMTDKNNYHWDCSGWIDIPSNKVISYQASKRLYAAICNDDGTAEYMGTIIASV